MPVSAYLLINTATGKENDVVSALNKISGVKQAHIVTGLHDAVCFIEGKDIHDLKSIIIKDVRGIQGIQRTVTCFAFNAVT